MMKRKFLIRVRSAVLVFLTHRIALPMLKIFRKPPVISVTETELSHFPEGTLGNDLYIFLKKRNLKLLKHYSRHDLKHILLDYDTTDEGEACLQSFMLGNGRISFPVIATVLYSLITMPEYWKQMRTAYQKGKHSSSVHDLSWQELLTKNTLEIKSALFGNC